MKIAYDLHIHSSLSPCADNEMTPNNIVNMSILKGLDVIAVTDHNSCANVRAISKCAEETNLLVIPGMELETSEEIHVVCLFPDIESAEYMQALVYSRLPDIKNQERIFGEQLIMDENDGLAGREDRLLLTSTSISINEVFPLVNVELKGLAIPSHIDRSSNSLLASFGMLPEDIDIKCAEIKDKNVLEALMQKHPGLRAMNKVFSSDAHYLWDIHERENFMDVDALCIEGILNALRK